MLLFFLSDQDAEGFSFFELLSAKMFERFSGDIPYVKSAESAVALESLEKRLRTKFPPNALVPAKAPWFPDRCLGAGCATWAVKTVQVFSDDFCHRMGIPTRARVGKERAV